MMPKEEGQESAKTERLEELQERLLVAVQRNEAPWQQAWEAGVDANPHNPVTGRKYHGMNAMVMRSVRDFDDPRWCGFAQAKKEGWHVKKGSKGLRVCVFSSQYSKKDEQKEERGDGTKKFKGHFVGYKTVFNAEQINGIPAIPEVVLNTDAVIELAENTIKNADVKINYLLATVPKYSPTYDIIKMPRPESFQTRKNYYRTVFHEIAHSTGSKDKFNRPQDSKNPKKAMREELRAEIASYMICSELQCGFGLNEGDNSSGAYLKSWLSGENDPKNELFRAVIDAEKIKDYVLYPERRRELIVSYQNSGKEDKGIER